MSYVFLAHMIIFITKFSILVNQASRRLMDFSE